MKMILKQFLNAQINLNQLKKVVGENLHNIKIETPLIVSARDLVFLIRKYLNRELSLQEMVDWANVVWFTDLFEYNEEEEDSISSVVDVLESLDEEMVYYSEEDFLEMIDCLLENREY